MDDVIVPTNYANCGVSFHVARMTEVQKPMSLPRRGARSSTRGFRCAQLVS